MHINEGQSLVESCIQPQALFEWTRFQSQTTRLLVCYYEILDHNRYCRENGREAPSVVLWQLRSRVGFHTK